MLGLVFLSGRDSRSINGPVAERSLKAWIDGPERVCVRGGVFINGSTHILDHTYESSNDICPRSE